ncbi:DgyrCDS5770 [Dimorphilus gyrociliatus]|uniref:DgyrCDS5770 n=1 Tax=Dimorphilus gyrociliatus TaxID=2664684 RepID=A0A7I8VKW3_9ANNE|nr:DgyrCDS5770 [Dimorphilus gyrociliatus]
MSSSKTKINIKKISRKSKVASNASSHCQSREKYLENGFERADIADLKLRKNSSEKRHGNEFFHSCYSYRDVCKHSIDFYICASCKCYLNRNDNVWKNGRDCVCEDCKGKLTLNGDWKPLVMNNNSCQKSKRYESFDQDGWDNIAQNIRAILQGDKFNDNGETKLLIAEICKEDESLVLTRLMELAYDWMMERKKHLTGIIGQTSTSIDESTCHLRLLLSQFHNLEHVAKRLQPVIEPLQGQMTRFTLSLGLYLRYLFKIHIGQDERVVSFLTSIEENCKKVKLSNMAAEFRRTMKEVDDDYEDLINKITSEREDVIDYRETILSEDFAFFKEQRKLLLQKSGKHEENEETAREMEEELRNILSGCHSAQEICPNCKIERSCCCSECCIAHFITCGIFDTSTECTPSRKLQFELDSIKPPSMSSASSASDYESTVEEPLNVENSTSNHAYSRNNYSPPLNENNDYYIASSAPASPEPDPQNNDCNCQECSSQPPIDKFRSMSLEQTSLYELHTHTEASPKLCANCGQNNLTNDIATNTTISVQRSKRATSETSLKQQAKHQHQQHQEADESNGDQCEKQGKFCDCCYCEFFGHSNPAAPQVSKNYVEMRDKLRQRLKKKKETSAPDRGCKSGGSNKASYDLRDANVDELVAFIEGDSKEKSAKAQKRARQKQKKLEEKAKRETQRSHSASSTIRSSSTKTSNERSTPSPSPLSPSSPPQPPSYSTIPTSNPSEFQLQIRADGQLHFVSPTRGERKVAVAKRKHPERKACGILQNSGISSQHYLKVKRSQTIDSSAKLALDFFHQPDLSTLEKVFSERLQPLPQERLERKNKEGSMQTAVDVAPQMPIQDILSLEQQQIRQKKKATRKTTAVTTLATTTTTVASTATESPAATTSTSSKRVNSESEGSPVAPETRQVNGDEKSDRKISPKSDASRKKKNKKKNGEGGGEDYMDVFNPKLDEKELDDAERELEQFKKFCQESSTIKPERRKKLNINYKDLVVKRKQ